MEGTQVTDIEKKVDYPQFKHGVKLSTIDYMNESNEDVSYNNNSEVNTEITYIINSFIKDENEAITQYEGVLSNSGLRPEDLNQIKEYIADEKNHLLGLTEMLKNYDGNIQASNDEEEES